MLDTQGKPQLVQNRPSLLPLLLNLSRRGLRNLLHPHIPCSQIVHPGPLHLATVRSISFAHGVTCLLGTAFHAARLASTKVQSLLPGVTLQACTSCIDTGHDTLLRGVCVILILAAGGSRGPIDWFMNVNFVADYGGTASLARRLHENAVQWEATGRLAFLNDWLVVTCLYVRLKVDGVSPTGRTSLVKKVVFFVVFRVYSLTLHQIRRHSIICESLRVSRTNAFAMIFHHAYAL